MMHHILIVDDSDVDRLLMSGLLRQSPSLTVIVAENGVQALKKLEEWPIELVLTDLQMPKMGGLELVQKIRERKLEIPVILTTGVGSEEIAAKALLAGASGYIPKSKLNEMLEPTITQVLKHFNNNQTFERLVKRTKLSRHELEIENDPALISLVVDFCEKILNTSSPLDRIDCLRIAMAVDQALQNAVYRGNLEIEPEYSVQQLGDKKHFESMPMFIRDRFSKDPFKKRKAHVVIEIKPSGFAIRIRDEGPGFNTSLVGDLSELSTRGTNLMRAFMDVVQYNDSGNEVLMKYQFDRSKVKRERSPSKKATKSRLARLVCSKTGSVHDISAGKFVIGTGKASHLKLESESVSSLHCMLVHEDNAIKIVTLSTQHDTLVNGKAGFDGQLKHGDVLSFGGHAFNFELAKN